MIKFNLAPWGGALTAFVIAVQPLHTYAAETCVAAPTCAELGYTLSSTATCAGTALKCPFDKTKFFCTQKSEVYTTILPNYSTRYTLSANTDYTVGSGTLASYKCLWVMFYTGGQVYNGATNYSNWLINGETVGAVASQNNEDYNSGMYPVFTGDKFKLKGGTINGNDRLYYYPCKGE